MTCQNPKSTSANNPELEMRELTDDDLPDLENFLNEAAFKYRAIGTQLRVNDSKIKEIEHDYSACCDRLHEVLCYCLRRIPKLTCCEIVKALESVNRKDVASKIESKYGCNSHSSMPDSGFQPAKRRQSQYDSGCQPAKRPCLDRFVDLLKNHYEQETFVIGANKWPRPHFPCFVDLECVDRTTDISIAETEECIRAVVRDGNFDVFRKKRKVIHYSDIAKGVSSTKKVILVEGPPGVGKSTLVHEMCLRWIRGEFGDDEQPLLCFSLCDKRMSEVASLVDLANLHPLGNGVAQELLDTKGENIMIILEGFDKLPEKCQRWPSVFAKLVTGYLLPSATILVTSRPSATQILLRHCSFRIFQHIQILGFPCRKIDNCMTEVLKDGELAARTHIRVYPQIKACMYIPVISNIVVTMYKKWQVDNCDMPKTLTELYDEVTINLLLRYLIEHPEYGEKIWSVRSLKKDLPEEVKRKLFALGKVAYSGIKMGKKDDVQLIFSNEDVNKVLHPGICSNTAPDFETLGLMQSVPQVIVSQGEVMFHNFLHVSIQEFLAALHISNMPQEEQLEHFKRQEKKFSGVLMFLAGRTKESLSENVLRKLLQIKPQITPLERKRVADIVLSKQHVNWMFEAQRCELVAKVLQGKTIEFMSSAELTLLDYQCLGYCIVCSSSQWILTINTGEEIIGEEQIQMLVEEIRAAHGTSASIVGLSGHEMSLLPISAKALNMFFNKWRNMIHLQELHLKLPIQHCCIEWPDFSKLELLHLGIGGKRNLKLNDLLSCLSLKSLTIESTSDDGTVGLEDSEAISTLLESSECLETLHFQESKHHISIDDRGMESIIKAMSENKSLRSIIIECECKFTSNAAHYLAQFIQNSTTLVHLSIGGCTFSAHGLLELAHAIHNSHLVENFIKDSVDLNNLTCTIDGDDEVRDYCKLSSDYLSKEYMEECLYQLTGSHISDEGVQRIAMSLSGKFLWKLDLSYNNVSDQSAATIAKALFSISTLWELDLSNGSITDTGSTAIAQALYPSTLNELNLSDNNTDGTTSITLADIPSSNSILGKLNLSNNRIGDTGSTLLAQALHHSSTNLILNLSGNDNISAVGTEELVQALTGLHKDAQNGLVLPRKCEVYATQCQQYSEVKHRITFR